MNQGKKRILKTLYQLHWLANIAPKVKPNPIGSAFQTHYIRVNNVRIIYNGMLQKPHISCTQSRGLVFDNINLLNMRERLLTRLNRLN